MIKKVSVVAPANIAFVKYWGRRNEKLILPLNDSVSMNLDNCLTKTTVEWGGDENDEVKIKYVNGGMKAAGEDQMRRVMGQIDRVRNVLGIKEKVKIWSENNFPADSGIASSASAFAALTKGLFEAGGVKLSEKELSIETRLSGSGSAARSIPGGFVHWKKGLGAKSESSFAYSILEKKAWDLCDLVLVVSERKKEVGSFEGHKEAIANEYLTARLSKIAIRVNETIEAIKEKDIEKLGLVIENEAISLHVVAMTSKPPIFYLNSMTWEVIQTVLGLRKKGVMVYFTMDAGPNVHLICEKKSLEQVKREIGDEFEGIKMIVNGVGEGAVTVGEHLF